MFIFGYSIVSFYNGVFICLWLVMVFFIYFFVYDEVFISLCLVIVLLVFMMEYLYVYD